MDPKARTKVTVVGSGQVGVACVVSIVAQHHCDEMVLVDILEDKVRGEVMDLQHASEFLHNVRIRGGSDYALSAGSNVVIITAGVRQKVDESRLDLVQRNVAVFKAIIPQVVKYSPDCCIIVVSNPCDIMTHVAWKLSGFPVSRVFGSGTSLDTARFRHFLAEKLGVGASSVNGWVIGEHGDSSVPVWSSVRVAGVPLADLCERLGREKVENWESVHQSVVGAAGEMIKLKGYTNWGIGMTVAEVVSAIVHNKCTVLPLSTVVEGLNGIATGGEPFASVPCLVCSHGIGKAIPMSLTEAETERFHKSVNTIYSIIKDVKLD